MVQRSALVLGDATVDWCLTLSEEIPSGMIKMSDLWAINAFPLLTARPGGSALVREIAEESVARVDDQLIEVAGVDVNQTALQNPNDPNYARIFATWRKFPRTVGSSEQVWRMQSFIGSHPADSVTFPTTHFDPLAKPSTVFFEDGNQRFRDEDAAWQDVIDTGADRFIVRQTGGLGAGRLWGALLDQWADQTTLICAVGDVRREGASIGTSLSWERMAQDVVQAVKVRPSLAAAKRVIVLLSTSGAVIVNRDGRLLQLFSIRSIREGDWEHQPPGIGIWCWDM